MLELKNINKIYKTNDLKQTALKNINVKFRKNEFVSILGPSGSGKTTLLNIIGGLDKYSSGDLIINGVSTKKYNDKDFDAYRNHKVGFVFQSYNLIPHQSALSNVELALTLSGVKKEERRKRAIDVLKRVGLEHHMHKRPNQMSGGQMQRVAIARALINNPDILLADEPTGALDSETSIQIMELLKNISKEKLVIMVTHNPELATIYSNRIIKILDGKIIDDSNPFDGEDKIINKSKTKKTSMSFLTALSLSLNNLMTKKGRTILTSFAGSIGIIGIALILSLSNGFKVEIDNFEKKSLSQAPITITNTAMKSTIIEANNREKFPNGSNIYVEKDIMTSQVHKNIITSKYIEYIENLDKTNLSGIAYQKGTNLIIVNKDYNGNYNLVSTLNSGAQSWSLLPSNPNDNENSVIDTMYDVLAGEIKDDEPGLVLQVDNKNQIYESVLEVLGLENKESLTFDDILNQELKLIINDDYYKQIGDVFYPNSNLEELYNSNNSITIKVQAIIRGKEEQAMITNGSGFAYTNALTELIINNNKNSNIVKLQKEKDYNILTNMPFDENITKDYILGYLGDDTIPVAIYLYPKDFNTKEKIIEYLDNYNKELNEEEQIQYTDMASMISSLSGGIMDAITVVLVAFSSISLVVSSIMIGIITYISVLERTREIGILRALGARAKDIKRVFNAETFIIGLVSGIIGIGITYLLNIPINMIIKNISGLPNVAKLNIIHAITLIIISICLTVIGGAIPSRIASKKDPVVALRTE
mgnify:FL=1